MARAKTSQLELLGASLLGTAGGQSRGGGEQYRATARHELGWLGFSFDLRLQGRMALGDPLRSMAGSLFTCADA